MADEFQHPPSGWYTFGTHAGWDSKDIPPLEFMGSDEAGMPLFERPVDPLLKIKEALAGHPKCEIHPEDDAVSCGWKSAVASITAVVEKYR